MMSEFISRFCMNIIQFSKIYNEIFDNFMAQYFNSLISLQTNTCSKAAIGILKKYVNFGHDSHLFSSISIFDFE